MRGRRSLHRSRSDPRVVEIGALGFDAGAGVGGFLPVQAVVGSLQQGEADAQPHGPPKLGPWREADAGLCLDGARRTGGCAGRSFPQNSAS